MGLGIGGDTACSEESMVIGLERGGEVFLIKQFDPFYAPTVHP